MQIKIERLKIISRIIFLLKIPFGTFASTASEQRTMRKISISMTQSIDIVFICTKTLNTGIIKIIQRNNKNKDSTKFRIKKAN